MKDNVLVLISTYNGEKYLKKLFDSVLNQQGCNCNILIRDDCSKDNTVEIIKEYQKKYDNIKFYAGENLGYAKSFWNLIQNSDDFDYYAFCDQDDIWLPNKLINAINLIKKSQDSEEQPVLYTSNVICVDNNMNKLKNKSFFCKKPLNVYESFQKSILPGCTFVFNNNAKKILKLYNGFMESHDWATYAIINTFGKVIYDSDSYIYYRIHEQNTIGVTTKFKNFKIKIKRFFSKRKNTRSKFAKDFYKIYASRLTDSNLKISLKELGYYKESKGLKYKLLFNKNFKGIIFKIYVFLNRV